MKRNILLIVVILLTVAGFGFYLMRPSTPKRSVVVYCTVDQVYAEAVLAKFSQQTGIKVLPVFDVEATKTTGLATRLIAEKPHPRADVFWNNEFVNTLRVQQEGVLAPYHAPSARDLPKQFVDESGYWSGVGGRARVFLVNTRRLTPDKYPAKLQDLLDPRWPAKDIGMAVPLFGTTATHAAAIYATMGPEKAAVFFTRIRERGVRMLDGNSVVRDQVVNGQLAWGITDSDDALVALENKSPVVMIAPDQNSTGTLALPGTVALVAGAPHPETARKLIDFLASSDGEQTLIDAGGCQFSLRDTSRHLPGLASPLRLLHVPLHDVFEQSPRAIRELREIYVR